MVSPWGKQGNATTIGEKPYFCAVDTSLYEGWKRYEVTNHLGNVLSVLSDRRCAEEVGSTDGIAEYYEAVVLAATDYYPFGLVMPNREYFAVGYRYGFNGKEKDSDGEWGDLAHYDYGFRIYNPALGRFLSVDPLARKFSNMSPYIAFGCNPIFNIDIDGKEFIAHYLDSNGKRKKATYNYQDNSFTGKDGEVITDNSFLNQITESFSYLKPADDKEIIKQVSNSDKKVNIRETSVEHGAVYSDRKLFGRIFKRTIHYSPISGVKLQEDKLVIGFEDENTLVPVETGEKQTPALGFYHEIAHAYEAIANPKE